MGEIIDGDGVEEIVAEPDDPGFIALLSSFFLSVHTFVAANGWYILLGGGAAYYLWKTKINSPAANRNAPNSPEEVQAWQVKEEQRLKAIQKLQERYAADAEARAEKQKLMEEKKRKDRLAEIEALEKQAAGHTLGGNSKSNNSSFRPGQSN